MLSYCRLDQEFLESGQTYTDFAHGRGIAYWTSKAIGKRLNAGGHAGETFSDSMQLHLNAGGGKSIHIRGSGMSAAGGTTIVATGGVFTVIGVVGDSLVAAQFHVHLLRHIGRRIKNSL